MKKIVILLLVSMLLTLIISCGQSPIEPGVEDNYDVGSLSLGSENINWEKLVLAKDGALNPGEELQIDEYLRSPNGIYRLYFQGDGNLVFRDGNGHALWSTSTSGRDGQRFVFQGDGNLVIYSGSGSALWASGTHGQDATQFEVTDYGQLILKNSSGAEIWVIGERVEPPKTQMLQAGDTMNIDDVLQSANGQYKLYFQGDGNLVLRNGSDAVWSSGSHGKGGNVVAFQGDGNLVIYTAGGSAIWSTGSHGKGATQLVVKDYGVIKIEKSNGDDVWVSSGSTPPNDPPSDPPTSGYYTSKGGVITGSSVTRSSDANNGDYEFVFVGTSQGSGEKYWDEPVNRGLMEGQGFRLVGCRGPQDRKIEAWVRVNSGQGSVQISAGRANQAGYAILTMDRSKISININDIDVRDHVGTHGSSSADLKLPSGSGIKIGAMFFDDSVYVTDAKGGDILHRANKFGDGDGFAAILYNADQNPPSTVSIRNDAGGARQLVSLGLRIK